MYIFTSKSLTNHSRFRIGGGVFLLLAAYAYFSPRETKDAAKRSALDLERTAERKVGISPLKEDAFEASRNMAAQTSDQAGKTMRELSGREKTKQGSFRHE